LIWFLAGSQVHRLVVNRDPKFTNFVEVIVFLIPSKFFISYFATSESEYERGYEDLSMGICDRSGYEDRGNV
jgi:hypothetical protein